MTQSWKSYTQYLSLIYICLLWSPLLLLIHIVTKRLYYFIVIEMNLWKYWWSGPTTIQYNRPYECDDAQLHGCSSFLSCICCSYALPLPYRHLSLIISVCVYLNFWHMLKRFTLSLTVLILELQYFAYLLHVWNARSTSIQSIITWEHRYRNWMGLFKRLSSVKLLDGLKLGIYLYVSLKWSFVVTPNNFIRSP